MDELIARLDNINLIAVDTEFFRETTYYPQLALVQIATDNIVACIDPLAFDAKTGLQKVLLDQAVTKIFHSCSQDLEVLFYYLGEAPSPIYDTQLANALLSDHHQVGYATLVENELGLQLDKSQTRTNWLQRPLTEKQIQYAGDDVFYLYQLHHKLENQLQHKGRKAWFDEDARAFSCDENSFQVVTDTLWKRVRDSSKLNRKQLAVVQSVALWREELAQLKDKTRRKALADDIIIQLAVNPPESLDKLNGILGRRAHLDEMETKRLFDVIQNTLQLPEEKWPDNRFNSLDAAQKQLLKKLQHMVNAKAEELGISSAVLYSRKDLEKLLTAKDNAGESSSAESTNSHNWRYQVLGQYLMDTVKNAK